MDTSTYALCTSAAGADSSDSHEAESSPPRRSNPISPSSLIEEFGALNIAGDLTLKRSQPLRQGCAGGLQIHSSPRRRINPAFSSAQSELGLPLGNSKRSRCLLDSLATSLADSLNSEETRLKKRQKLLNSTKSLNEAVIAIQNWIDMKIEQERADTDLRIVERQKLLDSANSIAQTVISIQNWIDQRIERDRAITDLRRAEILAHASGLQIVGEALHKEQEVADLCRGEISAQQEADALGLQIVGEAPHKEQEVADLCRGEISAQQEADALGLQIVGEAPHKEQEVADLCRGEISAQQEAVASAQQIVGEAPHKEQEVADLCRGEISVQQEAEISGHEIVGEAPQQEQEVAAPPQESDLEESPDLITAKWSGDCAMLELGCSCGSGYSVRVIGNACFYKLL